MEYIGYIAGCLSIYNLIPQLIKLKKTKSSNDLSTEREIILCLSVSLWLTYGICLNNIPMILANTSVLVIDLIILLLIIRYKNV